MNEPICLTQSPRQRRFVLAATILASGMAFLIGTAVTLALPTIQAELNTSVSELQWVVNAQLLTLASLLLIGGALGDRFGRKRIFIIGTVVFVLGALLAGLSKSTGQLIASQALQGFGAALMIPQSLAIINVCFAEEHRGQAIGIWAGVSGGIAALGPFLGGWLVQTFGWNSIFFINLPLGIAVVVITLIFVPESRNPVARRLDWAGTLCVVSGLAGLAYGLIQGPAHGWNNPFTLAALIGGMIMLVAFVLVEAKQAEPMVPLHIFRNPVVAGANLATLSLYLALYGVIFLVVLNLQQVQGLTPLQSGLGLLAPFVLITFLAGPAGTLADRIGPRLQMVAGPLVVAAGMAWLVVAGTQANYWLHFLPGMIVFGAGMAFVIAPLTKCALSVSPEYSGAASGFNNAVSRVAALMGVAALGALVISIFNSELAAAIAGSSLSGAEKDVILGQTARLLGIQIPETFSAIARETTTQIIKAAFVSGFRWAMGISAALAVVSAVIAFFTIHNRRPGDA